MRLSIASSHPPKPFPISATKSAKRKAKNDLRTSHCYCIFFCLSVSFFSISWRDTVGTFLQSVFRNFSIVSRGHLATCVAILLYCQNDVDPEVSKMAKAGLALAAQVNATTDEVREMRLNNEMISSFILRCSPPCSSVHLMEFFRCSVAVHRGTFVRRCCRSCSSSHSIINSFSRTWPPSESLPLLHSLINTSKCESLPVALFHRCCV